MDSKTIKQLVEMQELLHELAVVPTPDATAADATVQADPAEPDEDANTQLDAYLSSIIDVLQHAYDVADELASNVIFDVVDLMVAAGELEPLPAIDADPDTVTAWIGNAQGSNLDQRVLQYAQENEEDGADAPEADEPAGTEEEPADK